MDRRSFFKNLAIAPVIFAGHPEHFLPAINYSLPIPCDLSLSSLEWALLDGEKRNLGTPLKLIVGPELVFMAREILGSTPIEPEKLSLFKALNVLYYEKNRAMPRNSWIVEFERGTIGSEGP